MSHLKFISTLSPIVLGLVLSGCGAAPDKKPFPPLVHSFDSPGSYAIKASRESVVIPFEMYRGDIRMEVEINEQTCYFLVDNGSLWDELLFFGSPKVDALGLNVTGERILGDETAANPNIIDVASGVAVDFGTIVFTDQAAAIMRYIPGLPNPWEGADGQISAGFFKNFTVSIDFDESELTLTKPTSCAPPGSGYAAVMKPGPFDTRLLEVEIETTPGAVITMDLLIDLGGIHALYLPFGHDGSIALPDDAREEVLGVGYGSPDMGYIGRVSKVQIGPYEMSDVRAAFKESSGEEAEYGSAMIGMPLLQQFNLTFDYFCDRLILEPNSSFRDPTS
jgi:hypothetical protein